MSLVGAHGPHQHERFDGHLSGAHERLGGLLGLISLPREWQTLQGRPTDAVAAVMPRLVSRQLLYTGRGAAL